MKIIETREGKIFILSAGAVLLLFSYQPAYTMHQKE